MLWYDWLFMVSYFEEGIILRIEDEKKTFLLIDII